MAESYDKEWQLATLRESVAIWNLWRTEHSEIKIDLSEADLHEANLHEANLHEANLHEANLHEANLYKADLRKADLHGADLHEANLMWANLYKADLHGADLRAAELEEAYLRFADLHEANLQWADLEEANLSIANLREANLSKAGLIKADLRHANLREANLTEAYLREADLYRADLSRADLSRADLRGAELEKANLTEALCIETDFTSAKLTGCRIYGISSWDVRLDNAIQQDLRITPDDQPAITVDSLDVAQFIYLLLNNKNIRRVIDTITSKVVLILGRFTTERKAVLDALRDELRQRDYLPVVFDFDKPSDRSYTETVTLLARMARFIVADLTLPSSIPQELDAIIPTVVVPVRPLIELGYEPWAMYKDYWPYPWVLPVQKYASQNQLLTSIQETVIAPAEAKVEELDKQRQRVYQPEGIAPTPHAGEAERTP
jgi:uncharacterized protein YjbI with pentapeptide repeats